MSAPLSPRLKSFIDSIEFDAVTARQVAIQIQSYDAMAADHLRNAAAAMDKAAALLRKRGPVQ